MSPRKPNPNAELPPLCPNCGYDATGLTFVEGVAICPECGKKIDEAWARTVGDFPVSLTWSYTVPIACLLVGIACVLVPLRYKPEYLVLSFLSLSVLIPIIDVWRASFYRLEGHKPTIARRIIMAISYLLMLGVVLSLLGVFFALITFAIGLSQGVNKVPD